MQYFQLKYLIISVYLWLGVLSEECKFPSISAKDTQAQLSASQQLQRLHALHDKTFSASHDQNGKTYTYRFQLCNNPVSKVCKNLRNATIVAEGEDDNCVIIGAYNETDIRGGKNWVSLTFSGGDIYPELNTSHCSSLHRQSVVTVVCDSSQSEVFTVLQASEDNCYYSFVLNSNSACDTPQKGLSGGSVFCIIFFTVSGVYLLFGFLYRRLVVRAKGTEQIPNYEFWKSFGSLVADGCDFVCRCGAQHESKMYQGIDDPLGHEELESDERDDHLLPM